MSILQIRALLKKVFYKLDETSLDFLKNTFVRNAEKYWISQENSEIETGVS